MSQTLHIQVNNKWKELKVSGGFGLNIGIKDFGIEDPNANIITNTLTIPYECNKKELLYIVDSNSKDGIKIKCSRVKAIIKSKGLCREGMMFFDGYHTSLVGTCEVVNLVAQFVSGVQDFLESLPDELCDLEDCFEPFTVNSQNIVDNWQDISPYNGAPIYYGLTYQGGLDNSTTVPVSYLQPQIYDAAIIESISKNSGYEIKSDYFKTDYFRNHLLTFGNKCQWSQSMVQFVVPNTINFAAGTTLSDELTTENALSPNAVFFIDYNISNEVDNGLTDFLFLVNSGDYEMKMTFEIADASPTACIDVFDNDTQEQIGTFNLVDGLNELLITHSFGAGAFFRMIGKGSFDLLSGSTIQFCRKTDFVDGSFFFIGKSLPCKSIKDYLLDLQFEHNLIYFWDAKNKCLLVETLYDTELPTGEFIKGWYGSKSDAVNWTDKIVKGSEQGQFTSQEVERTLITGHCQDDDDKFTNSTYLDCTTILCDKYNKGETEKRMSCIGLLRNRELPEIRPLGFVNPLPIVPTEYEETEDGEPSEKYCSDKMKRLYKGGIKSGLWSFGNANFNDYPYVASFDNAINMSFCGDNGRMDLFYGRYIEQLNEKPQKTIRIKLDHKDIADLPKLFRTPKFIETISGCAHYVLTGISGYTFEDCDVVEATLLEI